MLVEGDVCVALGGGGVAGIEGTELGGGEGEGDVG